MDPIHGSSRAHSEPVKTEHPVTNVALNKIKEANEHRYYPIERLFLYLGSLWSAITSFFLKMHTIGEKDSVLLIHHFNATSQNCLLVRRLSDIKEGEIILYRENDIFYPVKVAIARSDYIKFDFFGEKTLGKIDIDKIRKFKNPVQEIAPALELGQKVRTDMFPYSYDNKLQTGDVAAYQPYGKRQAYAVQIKTKSQENVTLWDGMQEIKGHINDIYPIKTNYDLGDTLDDSEVIEAHGFSVNEMIAFKQNEKFEKGVILEILEGEKFIVDLHGVKFQIGRDNLYAIRQDPIDLMPPIFLYLPFKPQDTIAMLAPDGKFVVVNYFTSDAKGHSRVFDGKNYVDVPSSLLFAIKK